MVRLTDRPDMTLDVYRGRKTTMHEKNAKKKKKKALLWSNSVIKLVSVLFGKCTTLVVTK